MRKLIVVSLFAVLSVSPLSSFALTPAGGACVNEAKTLCKGTTPGGGRMLACLKTNMAKLSPACQKQTKEWPKAKNDAKAAAVKK